MIDLRRILIDWFNRRARKSMERKAEALERRRTAIQSHIEAPGASRRQKYRNWQRLKNATTDKLNVENQLARM